MRTARAGPSESLTEKLNNNKVTSKYQEHFEQPGHDEQFLALPNTTFPTATKCTTQ